MPSERSVTLLAYDGVQVLDVAGPYEVFAQANRFARESGRTDLPPYSLSVTAPQAGPVRSSGGLPLLADSALEIRATDTLMVPGGAGVHEIGRDPAVIAWIQEIAANARRVCSVCTGTFLLAEAGLLAGRRVTTHWRSAELLAQRFPGLTVEADAIFVRDGDVYSSAGVTAGMDLALALVEEDMGGAVAQAIARNLVLYLRRAGGQSQFSAALAAQEARTPAIRKARDWILAHLDQPLSVPDLAGQAAMSPRNFARVFAAEIGMPPGRYIERVRLDAARNLLSEGGTQVDGVARRTGFATSEGLRRAFVRNLGITPAEYRARFRPAI